MGENSVRIVLPPFWKGVYSKRKEFVSNKEITILKLFYLHSEKRIYTKMNEFAPLRTEPPNPLDVFIWCHYENMPILNILKSLPPKKWKFWMKNSDTFQISAPNIYLCTR